MFEFRGKLIKVKPVTLGNINEFLGINHAIQLCLNDKVVKRKLFTGLCKELFKRFCNPVPRAVLPKSYAQLLSEVRKVARYEDILALIKKNSDKNKGSTQVKKSELNPVYEIFLGFCNWSYEQVMNVEFIQIPDYIRVFQQRELHKNMTMLEMLKVGSSQYEIESYKKMKAEFARRLKEIQQTAIDEGKKERILNKVQSKLDKQRKK